MGFNYWTRYHPRGGGANIGPSKTCVFIAGERPYGDHPFCDRPSIEGSSYCQEHHELCHEPLTPTKLREFNSYVKWLSGKG